ncbi:hypothetical protein ONS96_011675 [Cadophora gregata f. sp. sojae]|nr:hypothetical protein ONS96_011675 [Cadophora gregata f. sp. sojae]
MMMMKKRRINSSSSPFPKFSKIFKFQMPILFQGDDAPPAQSRDSPIHQFQYQNPRRPAPYQSKARQVKPIFNFQYAISMRLMRDNSRSLDPRPPIHHRRPPLMSTHPRIPTNNTIQFRLTLILTPLLLPARRPIHKTLPAGLPPRTPPASQPQPQSPPPPKMISLLGTAPSRDMRRDTHSTKTQQLREFHAVVLCRDAVAAREVAAAVVGGAEGLVAVDGGGIEALGCEGGEEVFEEGPEGGDVHGGDGDGGFDHGPFDEVDAFPGIVVGFGEGFDVDYADDCCGACAAGG